MLKEYLNKDVPASGGLLFIVTAAFLALAMLLSVTLIRESTSTSVAKTVEQTISLQCLASCYINGTASDSAVNTNAGRTFKKISKNGHVIEPLKEFNSTMQKYNLMTLENPCTEMHTRYHKGTTNASTWFQLQFGKYQAVGQYMAGAHWIGSYVQPGPVKSVIEAK